MCPSSPTNSSGSRTSRSTGRDELPSFAATSFADSAGNAATAATFGNATSAGSNPD